MATQVRDQKEDASEIATFLKKRAHEQHAEDVKRARQYKQQDREEAAREAERDSRRGSSGHSSSSSSSSSTRNRRVGPLW